MGEARSQAEWKTWLSWLDTISKRVSTIDGVKTAVREPTGLSNRSPSLIISLGSGEAAHHRRRSSRGTGQKQAQDRARRGGGGAAAASRRRRERPSIIGHRLDDAARRRQDRGGAAPRRAVPEAQPAIHGAAAPGGNISGRWDVNIEFFSSKSQHTLFIEQNGNRIQGSHKGDFSVRDVFGTIEGNEVKLRSVERRPGDSVTFTFAGTLSGDTISGPIYMGEYLNAKFTAKRHSYPPTRADRRAEGAAAGNLSRCFVRGMK